MTTAEGLVFVGLCFIPAVLTVALFITKERMLGFPCGIMWAILGGYSFGFSTAIWDMYYLMGFASLFGMVVFTIYGAFALREKREAYAERELEKGEKEYIDEGKGEEDTLEGDNPNKPKISRQTRGVRARAKARREKFSRSSEEY